ncbi:MAG: inorganic diphosphatase [Clostridia bacterium]
MNIWHDIRQDRIKKDDFVSVIEITKGGKNKYELDKETGMLKLDRVLYTATHYPANYGFIPRTYADDHDPLDVLVLCQEKIISLTLVECYPIGVLNMIDGEEHDQKIIAVAKQDPFLNCYNDVSELPNHISAEIMHFFEVYKQLEGKSTMVDKILGREEAERIIQECIDKYNEKFGDREGCNC